MTRSASPNKIRTLIVDDETPARDRLRHLLKTEEDIEIIGECSNGQQALEALKTDPPDLVFLDIQMPRLTGLEVCAEVNAAGGAMPMVVFVTAYDEYALRAFEVHAVDYLLKPFDRERFQSTLDQVRQRIDRSGGGAEARLAALLAEFRGTTRHPDRLVYKQNGRIVFVRTDSIDWVESDGNYVRVHAGADSHYVRETLAGIENQLSAEKFMRISRSTIVNLDRVKEFQPVFYGDYAVILQNGSKLNMSRTYRDRLESLIEKPKAAQK